MWTDGRAETDRRTDMTKLIVAFRNSANAPKKKSPHSVDRLNLCVYMDPKTSSDYFPMLDEATSFYNRDGIRLLGGAYTDSLNIIQVNCRL